MNANELADVFDTYAEPHDWGIQAKNMLRQMGLAESIIAQQKLEIEALKLQLHTTLTNRDLRTYDGKEETK